MFPAIRLEHVRKHYGRVKALTDVSLDVSPGEIFGFLGLNGAGKTTAIRILFDLVRPTSGRAFVFGANCQTEGLDVRARIGYLPGELGFYGDMTGDATLDFLGRLNLQRPDPAWRRELLDRLQLSVADLRRKIREYSTGMKRKLGIVSAFQSDAALLVLDEPTEGLDPLMQDALYDLLSQVRRRGRTIFMSSHVLSEVERTCDRIAVLRQGELVIVSPVEDVRRLAPRTVRIVFREPVAPPPALSAVEGPAGYEVVQVTGETWQLRVRGPLGPVMALIAPLPVEDVEVREPRLEDVLRQYYKESPA
jgi:beta-exotoxin I transport system ATP-binding protein